MKFFLVLTEFSLVSILMMSGFAQETVADPTPQAPADYGSASSLTAKKSASDAEMTRAIQEARQMKALKAAMAEKAQYRQHPVLSNAEQFLKYNKPAVAVEPSSEEKAYQVPETYPRAEVPTFQKVKTEEARDGSGEHQARNSHSYPDQIDDGRESGDNREMTPSSAPVTGDNQAMVSPRKRRSFFSWLKRRKSAVKDQPTFVGASLESRPSPANAADQSQGISNAREEAAPPAPVGTADVSAGESPPEEVPGPAGPPSAEAIPVASVPPEEREQGRQERSSQGSGLFKKMFRKRVGKKPVRTISSDPEPVETIELPH